MTWLLSVLAVYRLAYLLTYEDGPFGLALRWRSWVQQRFAGSTGSRQAGSWLATGMACLLCVSFWLSAVPALFFTETITQGVLWWLGTAGAVLLIHFVVKCLMRVTVYLDILIARAVGG